jgi:hypothetical protein
MVVCWLSNSKNNKMEKHRDAPHVLSINSNHRHKTYDGLMPEIEITLKTQTDVAIVEHMERGEQTITKIPKPITSPTKQTSKSLITILALISIIYVADIVVGICFLKFISAKWLITCGVLGISMLVISTHKSCKTIRKYTFIFAMLCLWKILFIVYGIILLTKHIEKFELRYMLVASVALETLKIVTYLFMRCRRYDFLMDGGDGDIVFIIGMDNHETTYGNVECNSCCNGILGCLEGFANCIGGCCEIFGSILSGCDGCDCDCDD